MVVSSSTSSDDHFQYQNLSFTHKLFDILSDERNREIVTWNRDGDNFEVLDPKALESDVLPRYFRHSRFQSLVRQLNFYSFKKVGKERSSWIYCHEYFKRGQPELLISLKRKTNLGGMVHRSNPIRTTANPPAWKASSARVRQDTASTSRPHRDSFDSMDSKCLTQISDLSTLSERDDEEDDQNEEEENESIETIEQPKEPLVTPSPQINMTSIVPLLPLSTIGTWYPLCTLQKQQTKDSFRGKVPIFPPVGIDPFFLEGLHSKLGTLTTSLKSQTSSPKSSFSEDFHTDIEDMEEVQLSFTNKATLSLLSILEQRSLRIDQFNAIMSFLHHLYQLPSASCNTTYEIFHFLALYPELSYEIALYMQALNCSIDNLPFFKGKEPKTLSENICQKNSSNQSFIFGGDLTKSQVQEIISHFLRYTMNLLQDIMGDLQKLTYGSESMNEFIACGSWSQFYSFQKELTQSFNYLSRQYDLITTL